MSRNPDGSERTGMEELRLLVQNFDRNNESFNDRFTVPQLLKLHEMWQACGWDIFPDTWSERQVKEALRGKIPCWKLDESPFYPKNDDERADWVAQTCRTGKYARVQVAS